MGGGLDEGLDGGEGDGVGAGCRGPMDGGTQM